MLNIILGNKLAKTIQNNTICPAASTQLELMNFCGRVQPYRHVHCQSQSDTERVQRFRGLSRDNPLINY